jgi:CheY-like chemotaxis protein
MLIDDDPLTNSINKMLIQEANCSDYVVKKETALSALDYLSLSGNERNNLPFPNLIFLDVEMPKINGWEFLQYYNGIRDSLSIKPVIYLLSSGEITPPQKKFYMILQGVVRNH